MNNIVAWIIGALILVVLILLFRVSNLVAVLKGDFNKRVTDYNKLNAVMFPIFFLVGLILFYFSYMSATKYFLPKSASEHGIITDELFWIDSIIILIAFISTNILLFFFPYMYQYKEGRKAYFYPDNHKLEIIWTIIPAIVMAVLVFFGLKVWNDIESPAPKDAVVLEITGKQFNWIVRYPGKDGKLGAYNFKLIDATNEVGIDFTDKSSFDDFMPREIHIPKGRPVQFKIRARDVLHSVFLPHFRQKMDAVPGMPTSFWFTPIYTTDEMRTITGNPNFKYELACTEVCGRGHFGMKYLLVVDEPEVYEKWYASQEPFLKKNPDYISKSNSNNVELAFSK
ncbi:MAG: cytochrome c oxidase subunit II [Cytophagales bacterium]|nr:cytochrome c oxidase subunit II [Cytophagales bacterium]